MTKLNQINALVSGKKGETEKKLGDLNKALQQHQTFDGMVRTYSPHDENGEQLPGEAKRVQTKVRHLIEQYQAESTELFNLVATQDAGNQLAKAGVIVDGNIVLAQVPVTTLLFLEKQVNNILNFLKALPTPAPEREWDYDQQTDMLKSKPVRTNRSKKVLRNHVKYDATKEHPAQVEVYSEDIPVGTWTQFEYTTKIPMQEKIALYDRAKKLLDAVKVAREQANQQDVKPVKIGEALFSYLSGK